MPLIIYDTIETDGDYPAAKAEQISYKDGRISDFLPVYLTQEVYDELVTSGECNPNTPYFIIEEG